MVRGRSLVWSSTALDISPIDFTYFFAFSLFSFFEGAATFAKLSLAGDDLDESKNSKLPSLRKDYITGYLGREKSEPSQLPSLWQSKGMEKREELRKFRGNTALLLQGMRPSFFKLVTFLKNSSFSVLIFSFILTSRRLSV
jgi:hypothetical protein